MFEKLERDEELKKFYREGTFLDDTVSKSASVTGLYRSLDMGEIILEGDEGSPDKKTWVKITRDDPWGWVIGMTVCMMVPNIRREI